MKKLSSNESLKREMRRLMRSMDFVSEHPVLQQGTPKREAERLAEIYQQLGMFWEFLALQCRHREGWRKTTEGKFACKICGLVRGVKESWLLLLREGKKVIGHRAMPNSKQTFPSRKLATVVNDTVEFHGAKLNVEVLNRHRSRLFSSKDITVAEDRLVRLEEGGGECRLDEHLVSVELRKHRRGERPPYSGFVGELPRKLLKRFPVMLEYDQRGRFVGVVIFKPAPQRKQRRAQIVPKQPDL